MPQIKDHLRLGTRGSPLALAQSRLVADDLMRRHAGLRVEMAIVKTTGDAVIDRPLYEVGGKGVFTKEIELALLRGEIDFAVHSLKDMPVTMPLVDQGELVIAAIPPRGPTADVLVSAAGRSIHDLPRGARVGTSSLRRRARLLDARPDLQVLPIRGNIDTRLQKWRQGDYDALILAEAGLRRLGEWDDATMHVAPQFIPAAGQGALAVQCCRSEAATLDFLTALDDVVTRTCVDAERQLVRSLRGDCQSPIGVLVERIDDGKSCLRASVAAKGGKPPVVVVEVCGHGDLPRAAFELLRARGAMQFLHED